MERFTNLQKSETPHPLRAFDPSTPPLVWLVGAHGGAGTTFLGSSLAYAFDCGQDWPELNGDCSPLVAVVARETMTGLDAASHMLRQWHTDPALEQHELLGLITVPPAKSRNRHKEIKGWETSISGITPHIWKAGWVPTWPAARPSELARWWPGDPYPQKRQKYSADVPATIAALGQNLFEAARLTLNPSEG